jgi:hypothetical protein
VHIPLVKNYLIVAKSKAIIKFGKRPLLQSL